MSTAGRILIIAVCLLLLIGLVMLMSASQPQAELHHLPPLHFFKVQLLALSFALLLATIAYHIDYHFWCKIAWPLYALSLLLLLLVLFTPAIKGSHRWFHIGPSTAQPSEFAKFTTILILASWYSHKRRARSGFLQGLLLPGLLLSAIASLILLEPDFGATLLIGASSALLMFVAGAPWLPLLLSSLAGLSAIALLIYHNPERMSRIFAFLHPEAHANTDAYQLVNSIYGFFIGGPMGQGLSSGIQKRFYLPDPHTDFIFAVIAEELGILGSLGVVALFLVLLFCGCHIAGRAPDTEGRLLAFGITILLSMQACINIGVVTGRLPTKGLPLPFISYGGSALTISLFMIAILLRISRKPS